MALNSLRKKIKGYNVKILRAAKFSCPHEREMRKWPPLECPMSGIYAPVQNVGKRA